MNRTRRLWRLRRSLRLPTGRMIVELERKIKRVAQDLPADLLRLADSRVGGIRLAQILDRVRGSRALYQTGEDFIRKRIRLAEEAQKTV
jgi:hypothetical protein